MTPTSEQVLASGSMRLAGIHIAHKRLVGTGDWTVGEPCCTPNRFNCIEVPDVFQVDGRWYMLALTGNAYGQPNRWSDPNVEQATIVFTAERPEGPFMEVRDNFVIAGHGQRYGGGGAARTVAIGGERLMLYTRAQGDVGVPSLPVKLVSRPGGGLLPVYWNGIDRVFGQPAGFGPIEVRSSRGWAVRPVENLPPQQNLWVDSGSGSRPKL